MLMVTRDKQEKRKKQEDPRIVWELKRKNQQRAIEKTRDMMGRTDIKFEDYLKAKEDSVKHRRKSSGKF